MRRLFAASALIMVFGATPGVAEEYPWCVLEPGHMSMECRFTSYDQCHATAMGIGDCWKNPAYKETPAPIVQSAPPPPVTSNNDRRKRQAN
jgi:hypothetical protein